jgi:hypothetical protein
VTKAVSGSPWSRLTAQAIRLEEKAFLPTVGKSPAADCFVWGKKDQMIVEGKNGGPNDDVAVLNIEVEQFLASLLN